MPSIFDVRQRPLINSVNIRLADFNHHMPIKCLTIKSLRLDFLDNLLSQIINLVYKLRSELIIRHFIELLKVRLSLDRPNHRSAISVLKKMLEKPANPVLGLNSIGNSLLQFKCLLKVVFLRHLVTH